jgi:hypothetical protein
MTTGFMKEFLDGEKSPEEKALLAKQMTEKQRDIMTIDADAFLDEENDEDDAMGCDLPTGGCGGCGCRS